MEVLAVEADKVTPEANFADDLDADSLDLVELVMALEEEFDITVEEEELEGIETVGQAFDLVSAKLGLALAWSRRVAVTGVGVARRRAASGVDAFWAGLYGAASRGRAPRAATSTRRPCFDNPKEARRADRVDAVRPGRRHAGARAGRRARPATRCAGAC